MSDSRERFEAWNKLHPWGGPKEVHWEVWQARDAEVAGLREALSSISLAERDTTSSDRQKVVSMARIAREAPAANPTSERVTVEEIARLVDSWVLDNVPNGLPYLAYTDTLSKAICALLQRKGGW